MDEVDYDNTGSSLIEGVQGMNIVGIVSFNGIHGGSSLHAE